MANADPRHNGLFGAAWTFGYVAATAEATLDALTLSPLTGPFGLLDGKAAVWPIFHVVRAFAGMAARNRFLLTGSRPDSVQGIAAEAANGGKTAWLANLTAQSLTIRLKGARGSGALWVRSVDAASWPAAATGERSAEQTGVGRTLTLAPFAAVQIDESA